jgi:undecaprenyl-phosphate 4-deoxy-4-formamido-L-arabinose transferase
MIAALRPLSPRPTLSVVVPVYRSQPILRQLVLRLEPVLRAEASEFELLLVSDASPDGSWSVIEGLARERSWIRGVELRSNVGQHAALLCGILLARHEVIVTMDDDLQHPPEELAKLLGELDKGFDVVYGAPGSGRRGLVRNVGSKLAKWMLRRMTGIAAMSQGSSLRAFRSQLRGSFPEVRAGGVCIDVLLAAGTDRFGTTPVRIDPRQHGASTYDLRALLAVASSARSGSGVGAPHSRLAGAQAAARRTQSAGQTPWEVRATVNLYDGGRDPGLCRETLERKGR